jgi:hypothetical protein
VFKQAGCLASSKKGPRQQVWQPQIDAPNPDSTGNEFQPGNLCAGAPRESLPSRRQQKNPSPLEYEAKGPCKLRCGLDAKGYDP